MFSEESARHFWCRFEPFRSRYVQLPLAREIWIPLGVERKNRATSSNLLSAVSLLGRVDCIRIQLDNIQQFVPTEQGFGRLRNLARSAVYLAAQSTAHSSLSATFRAIQRESSALRFSVFFSFADK